MQVRQGARRVETGPRVGISPNPADTATGGIEVEKKVREWHRIEGEMEADRVGRGGRWKGRIEDER